MDEIEKAFRAGFVAGALTESSRITKLSAMLTGFDRIVAESTAAVIAIGNHCCQKPGCQFNMALNAWKEYKQLQAVPDGNKH